MFQKITGLHSLLIYFVSLLAVLFLHPSSNADGVVFGGYPVPTQIYSAHHWKEVVFGGRGFANYGGITLLGEVFIWDNKIWHSEHGEPTEFYQQPRPLIRWGMDKGFDSISLSKTQLSRWSTISAIKEDGSLWVHYTMSVDPAKKAWEMVDGDFKWQETAGNLGNRIAIRADGTLWMWQDNLVYLGQNEKPRYSTEPKRVGKDNDWETVSTGISRTYAIKKNGTLWLWDHHIISGKVLAGITLDGIEPVQIGSDNRWRLVSCGFQQYVALDRSGQLWQTGRVWDDGKPFNKGGRERVIPLEAPELVNMETDWITASSGDNYSLALKADGTLWAWGWNNFGQLGDETIKYSADPIQIGKDKDWQSVVAGDGISIALKKDGSLWQWGGLGPVHRDVFDYPSLRE